MGNDGKVGPDAVPEIILPASLRKSVRLEDSSDDFFLPDEASRSTSTEIIPALQDPKTLYALRDDFTLRTPEETQAVILKNVYKASMRLSVLMMASSSNPLYLRLLERYSYDSRSAPRELKDYYGDFQHMLSHLLSEDTYVDHQKLVAGVEEYFTAAFVPDIAKHGAIAMAAMHFPSLRTALCAVATEMEIVNRLSADMAARFDKISRITIATRTLLEGAGLVVGLPQEYTAKMHSLNLIAAGIVHDSNNILQEAVGFSELAQDAARAWQPLEKIKRYVARFEKFNFKTAGTAIELAVKLQAIKSKKKNVQIISEGIPELTLSQEERIPFFRIAYELTNNAIKYSDEAKEERMIRITHEEVENGRRFTFFDNGVGISDVDAALKLGVRLSPQLAAGTGTGLPTVVALATNMGWPVTIDSLPGHWTAISIDMPRPLPIQAPPMPILPSPGILR